MTDAHTHLSPAQQKTLVERCADPWTLYEQIFSAAVASGEIPKVDPTLASTMFAGLIQGQTWSLKTGRVEGPLDWNRARLLVDTLFGGLNAVYATVDPKSGNSARTTASAPDEVTKFGVRPALTSRV